MKIRDLTFVNMAGNRFFWASLLTWGYRWDHDLDLERSLASLPLLLLGGNGLLAHDATTPLAAGLLVLVEVAVLDGGNELGKLVLVLGADLGESEDSSGL